jgi:hypothetical protein
LLELTPEREAELKHWRALWRDQWRIAADCGDPPTDAQKAYDMVRLEMGFAQPDVLRAISVASYARAWLETGNPYNLDFAKLLCRRSGIAPPPALAELDAQLSEKRIEGNLKGGTATQIKKENARGFAYNLMSCLGAAGATREASASKAAQYLASSGSPINFKASVLEKKYPDEWKRIEADRKSYFAEPGNEALLSEWQQIRQLLPEADDDRKGNRRD